MRAAACREAESIWTALRFTKEEARLEWKTQMPAATALRDKIERAMDYAFRKNSDLLNRLQVIRDGTSNEDLIQDLNDLSVLGNQNIDLLKAINFELDLLDKASQASSEMASLLASATGNKTTVNQAKNIRDRAYTHLKEAMTEIRQCGQYVFAENKDRLHGYINTYKRIHRKKTVANSEE